MPGIDSYTPTQVGVNEGSTATILNNGNVSIFYQLAKPGGSTISSTNNDGTITASATTNFTVSVWLLGSAPGAQADINVAASGGSSAPTGPAGGSLTGSYPNPGLSSQVARSSSSGGTVTPDQLPVATGVFKIPAGTNVGNANTEFASNSNVVNMEIDYMRAASAGPGFFIPGSRVQGRALYGKYFNATSFDSQQANSTGVFLVDTLTGEIGYTNTATVGNESDAVPQGWVLRGFGARLIAHIAKAQVQNGTGSIVGAPGIADYLFAYYAASQGARDTGSIARQHIQYYAQNPATGSLGSVGAAFSFYGQNAVHSEDSLTIGNSTIEASLNASIAIGATSLTLEIGQGASSAQQAVTGTTANLSANVTGLSSVAYPVVAGAFISGMGFPLGTTILSVGASSLVASLPAGLFPNSVGTVGTGTLTIGGGLKGGAFAASGSAQLDVGANAEVVAYTISNDTVTFAACKNAHGQYARFVALDANGFGGWHMVTYAAGETRADRRSRRT